MTTPEDEARELVEGWRKRHKWWPLAGPMRNALDDLATYLTPIVARAREYDAKWPDWKRLIDEANATAADLRAKLAAAEKELASLRRVHKTICTGYDNFRNKAETAKAKLARAEAARGDDAERYRKALAGLREDLGRAEAERDLLREARAVTALVANREEIRAERDALQARVGRLQDDIRTVLNVAPLWEHPETRYRCERLLRAALDAESKEEG